LRFETLDPLELRRVRVEVEPWVRSRVVEPPEKETLVSATVRSLKRLQMAVERNIYDYRRNRCAKGTTEGDVEED
jgi:hypothetical protein